MNEHYADINARTVDSWAQAGWQWGVPITPEVFARAKAGDWHVVLTPTKPVPRAWFPPMAGCKVLGLASGGGQQMPIFAALGAQCTVLDYSPQQLESERMVAQREGYHIRIVRHDMSQPLPFEDGAFDLIFHPVSNCYIEHVRPLWRECHRVLRPGGVLLAGMDVGYNYLFDDDEERLTHRLPFNPLKNKALLEQSLRENAGVQFSHTLEEQLGGQLEAGFRLTYLYEDTNGTGRLHEHGVPSFCATRAVRE